MAFPPTAARVLRWGVAAGIAAAVLAVAAPFIDDALHVARLVREPPPAALAMPVQGVMPRALRDTYGAPRGADRRHEGIDIFARRGTPVVASTRGAVLRAGTNELGGNVVWVLGPGGDRHYYAHLDSIAELARFQRVSPGTVLGYVGTTGNAAGTPPHLHYGIYRRGSGAINPFPLLRAAPADGSSLALR